MAHSHTHTSSEQPKDNNARRLMFAFCITAGFMLVEVVGGILRFHWPCWPMPGICSLMPQRSFLRYWPSGFPIARPTIRHTFGWLRLTTLAAFVKPSLVVTTILTSGSLSASIRPAPWLAA